MANAKITELEETTSLDGTELFAVVEDPSGTPVTKKSLVSRLIAYLNGTYVPQDLSGLTSSTSPDSDDLVYIWLDGAARKVALSDLVAFVLANPTLTGTVTVPDGALAIADTSGLQTALDGKAPAFSGARAFKSTPDQTITTSTWTKLTFDTEVFDTGGNLASSTFTAPAAGKYRASGGVLFAVNATGGRGIRIRTATAVLAELLVPAAATEMGLTTETGVIELALGDTIEVHCFHSKGSDLSVVSSATHPRTFISVERLS